MDATTYTKARKNFATVMNKVCEDHSPIIITRQKTPPVVVISLEDFNAIKETLYILRSTSNAIRINSALDAIENKQFIRQKLTEI